MVGDANHGKEETLTGHDGMREIDGFLIDAVIQKQTSEAKCVQLSNQK